MSKVTDDLKRVPLFSELSQRQLSRLGRLTRERWLEPGTSVVQEGKMSGIGFFIVSEGAATVTVGGQQVATLGPGDHFGELAMITEKERTAIEASEKPRKKIGVSDIAFVWIASTGWEWKAPSQSNSSMPW